MERPSPYAPYVNTLGIQREMTKDMIYAIKFVIIYNILLALIS